MEKLKAYLAERYEKRTLGECILTGVVAAFLGWGLFVYLAACLLGTA